MNNNKKSAILSQLQHIANHWLLVYDEQVIDQVVFLWEQLETHIDKIVAFDLPVDAKFNHSVQGLHNQSIASDLDAIDCSDAQALTTVHNREDKLIGHKHGIKNS